MRGKGKGKPGETVTWDGGASNKFLQGKRKPDL